MVRLDQSAFIDNSRKKCPDKIVGLYIKTLSYGANIVTLAFTFGTERN